MSLRLSSRRSSGIRQIHRGRKKSVKFATISSPCWPFFFDIEFIVHKDFVPPGQTVNGKFYCEVVKRLMVGIRRTRTDKLKKSNWFLQHDNAPAFTSFVVDNSWLPNHYSGSSPPYSPDIAPATFPIPQDEITDERFSFSHDWGDPRRNARYYGHTNIWELQGCMKSWETHWDRCVHALGEYFEGDSGN